MNSDGKNYMVIDGRRIELSEETARKFRREFGSKSVKPTKGEKGYIVHGEGTVHKATFERHGGNYWNQGNGRKTKEGAEKHSEWQRAMQRLWVWREENGVEEGPYNTGCVLDNGRIYKQSFTSARGLLKLASFSSSELAEKCIREYEGDLRIIAGKTGANK